MIAIAEDLIYCLVIKCKSIKTYTAICDCRPSTRAQKSNDNNDNRLLTFFLLLNLSDKFLFPNKYRRKLLYKNQDCIYITINESLDFVFLYRVNWNQLRTKLIRLFCSLILIIYALQNTLFVYSWFSHYFSVLN